MTYFEQEPPQDNRLAKQWQLSSCTRTAAMFKMICVKLQGKTSIYIHANTA